MKNIVTRQLHWAALGVGLLALTAGLSVSVWLLQRDDGPGLVLESNEEAPAPGRNTPGGLETGLGGEGLPGLPVRFAGDAVPGRQTGDNGAAGSSTEAEAVQVQDTVGAAPGLTAVEGATMGDSAELEVQRGEAPPGGGPGDTATMGDSAVLVVRDASGKIKTRETVR